MLEISSKIDTSNLSWGEISSLSMEISDSVDNIVRDKGASVISLSFKN